MKTTMNIDDDLLRQAMELSNIKEKTALVHAGLKALIAQYSRKRLIALGGLDKKAKTPSRRRVS